LGFAGGNWARGSGVDVCFDNTITPKVFEFVEFSGFWVENVYNHVEVVQADPVRVPAAGSGLGDFSGLVLHTLLHVAGDGSYLGGRFTFADKEKISGAIVELTQVDANDVSTFDILDAVQDKLQSRIQVEGSRRGSTFDGCIQIDLLAFVKLARIVPISNGTRYI